MRIERIRDYLFDILDELVGNTDYQLNVNFIEKDNFSIDRLPIDDDVENWIIPTKLYREVYELRSSKPYSADILNNLNNIGFFENFERKIYSNNRDGILPDIDGIESVKCLNVGSLAIPNTPQAIFTIQIEIQYRDDRQNLTSI